MVDLKKKYKKAFDANKFAGKTVTSNIVDTSSNIQKRNRNKRKRTIKQNLIN